MYANKVTIFAFVNFFLVIQAHTIFTTLFTAGKKPLVEHDEATIGTPPPKVLQRSATLWNNIHSWDDTNSKNTVERAEDFVTVPPPTEILQRSFRCNRRLGKRVQASFACRPYDARMKRDKAAAADDADTDDSRKMTAERAGIGAGDPDGDWDWAGLVDGDVERDEAAAADDATVNDGA